MKMTVGRYIWILIFQFCTTVYLHATDFPVTSYLSIDQGLSNNSVRSIYQDRKGFMWFGTYDGLNRYDGYTFKTFRNSYSNSNSLINNWINSISEDLHGQIWIGTRQGGCIYNSLYDRFSFIYSRDKSNRLKLITSVVRSIEHDERGNMLIGTTEGLFFCAEGDTVAVSIPLKGKTIGDPFEVSAIKFSKEKTAWVFVNGTGLCTYDYEKKQLLSVNAVVTSANCLEVTDRYVWVGSRLGVYRYNLNIKAVDEIYSEGKGGLSYKDVIALAADEQGKLWIATNGAGLNILNMESGALDYLFAGSTRYSLTSNSIGAIAIDKDSRKWIGTLRGGINVIDPYKERFHNIVSEATVKNTLVSNYIFCFHEEKDGSLWIGSDGEGISVWNRHLNNFTNFRHDPDIPTSLSDNFITAIQSDAQNTIWIATYKGGVNRYDRLTRYFEHCRFVNLRGNELSGVLSFSMLNDRQNNLWASSLQFGLFKLNRSSHDFMLFDSSLRDLLVLRQDRNDILWGGNLSQLVQIDIESKKHFYFSIGKPVRSILEDKSGRFWVGTEGAGLILFDRKTHKIVGQYTTDEGLCSNSVLNILEDSSGNLWISTFNGISMLDKRTRRFRNYYQSDGLQSNQFNYNAALSLANGEMVFGGIKGVTIFNPVNIISNKNTPAILFTDIKVNNTSLDRQVSLIDKAGDDIETIKIPFNKAILSFEFSALEFSAPDKIKYAYYLQGWDRGWNYIGNQRSALYTHLSEGTYTMRVKCTNAEGVWAGKQLMLKITVLPPWYRTWWAYFIYLFIIGAAVYFYLQYHAKQTRLRYEVKIANLNIEKERGEKQRSLVELEREKAEREKKEAELLLEKANVEKEKAQREREQVERENERILNEKEKEINEKRISFVTNVSHEFRTPLTLILNPVEELLKKNKEAGIKPDSDLGIIYRNARRMRSLVDQLLLFQKAESGMDSILPSRLNLYNLANEVYLCFIQQVKNKNIEYIFECANPDLEIYADREKLEIILFNLLSNAIKYTPDNGSVKFVVEDHPENVILTVHDTGVGIPSEVEGKLFEKFYKAQRSMSHTKAGFGIGLYLVKQFTQQHKGTISYKSEEGKGSLFSLVLLKGREHFREIIENKFAASTLIEELNEESVLSPELQENGKQIGEVITEKQTILIIDDDEQIRGYLRHVFRDQYLIKEADNGENGLKLAKKLVPDLIISDIQMPGMNGIELCKIVKESESLFHIPFVLLTASISEETKLRGIEGGADEYITKPFDNTLLLAQVANLLKRRNSLQKYFYNEITLNRADIKISSDYKEFLEKCIAIVENHLDNENFTVKTLLSEMGMSHSNLFRKVKSVSGQSVNVFIRYIRLRKAAEFFIKTNYNVNETALMVGINDIKYFREQFNKLFGMNPSEYIRKYRMVHGKQFTINREFLDPNT